MQTRFSPRARENAEVTCPRRRAPFHAGERVRSLVVRTSLALVVIGMTACGGSDDTPGPPAPPVPPPPVPKQAACDTLAGRTIANSTVSTATLMAATSTIPEYCSVAAKISGSNINFAVRLPTQWNGKTRMTATGGWQGVIAAPNANALNLGFVDYVTDSGHAGAALDASFVFNGDEDALANFASIAYERVASATSNIVAEYYGRSAEKSYFEGCSGAGRVALVMAQRYPGLFDGVIASAPGPNFVGVSLQSLRGAQAVARTGVNFSPAKLTTLSRGALDVCDGLDGAIDGIVSNPLACSFNPEVLRCAPNTDNDSCLNDQELTVVDEVTSDSVLPNGVLLSKGRRLLGGEAVAANWPQWINPNPNPAAIGGWQFGAQIAKVLTRDPTTDGLSYDWNADVANIMNLSGMLDVWPGDLSAFGAAGGKLVIWNGTVDTPVPFENQIAYYNSAVQSLGGGTNAANTVKLYLLPGVNHCGGGVGASSFNFLQALDDWVTSGAVADGKRVTRLAADGTEALSRPLCAYPTYPRYAGVGDVTKAENFTCVAGPN